MSINRKKLADFLDDNTEFDPVEQMYKKILENAGLPEILTSVAEEASEVAQAALKLRRAILCPAGNSTPKDRMEAIRDYLMELGDLACSINASCADRRMNPRVIYNTECKKRQRWIDRINRQNHPYAITKNHLEFSGNTARKARRKGASSGGTEQ